MRARFPVRWRLINYLLTSRVDGSDTTPKCVMCNARAHVSAGKVTAYGPLVATVSARRNRSSARGSFLVTKSAKGPGRGFVGEPPWTKLRRIGKAFLRCAFLMIISSDSRLDGGWGSRLDLAGRSWVRFTSLDHTHWAR